MDLVPPISTDHAPGAGQTLRVLGDLVTLKAVAADTRGAYALFEVRTAPGQGMPPHRQCYEDEALFVLEGTYAVQIGARIVELGPGDYAFVPREMPHAYTNAGPAPGRLLVLVSPGGIHEQFLAEIGARTDGVAGPAPPDPADIAPIARAAEKYGVEFLTWPAE